MQVANDITLTQLKSTRLASEGVVKHVADVRLLVPSDIPDDVMYDLLIKQARNYLNTPQLDRGVVRINNSNFTTVYDPEGSIEIQHAHGHKSEKSPILTVIHEYIKKTPGYMYGFTEEHVIEVILRLSVVRTDILHSSSYKLPTIESIVETPILSKVELEDVSDRSILRTASVDIPHVEQDAPKKIRRR